MVLDQLIIPWCIFFFILNTCLLGIVLLLLWEILSWSPSGVRRWNTFRKTLNILSSLAHVPTSIILCIWFANLPKIVFSYLEAWQQHHARQKTERYFNIGITRFQLTPFSDSCKIHYFTSIIISFIKNLRLYSEKMFSMLKENKGRNEGWFSLIKWQTFGKSWAK